MKKRFLIISSIFYMSTGLTDILGTFSEVRNKGFSWIPFNLDERHLGYVWLICGIAVFLINSLSKHSFEREPTSFILLTLPAALYSVIFAISLFFDRNTGAIRLVEIYTYIVIIMIYIGGWPDPPELKDIANDV